MTTRRTAGRGPSVTDEAINRIKGLIVAGELRPGDRMPAEAELASQLGLSRNSLREAVRGLALLRVLDVRQGDGTYVSSLEPQQLLEVMSFVVDLLHDGTSLELIEVRRMLEPEATALAAAAVTDEMLAELRDLMEQMGKAATSEELVSADASFHDRIAQATGNSVLVSVLRSLATRTLRARRWRGIVDDGAIAQTHAGHAAIYRALEARDPGLARAAALSHIGNTQAWLRNALKDVSP
ncbi:FadR/GntR family transcriptional regulator [Fodinicola acaciae]|uniref:FadR/GntR family transcriptional regulator n=1 Tax=Fodinicola acaciae TaxID=2681555 RepID=UPI0013D0B1B2|nr:FadR/GntR family transcriptional regulator [Fodinicola acaciae]